MDRIAPYGSLIINDLVQPDPNADGCPGFPLFDFGKHIISAVLISDEIMDEYRLVSDLVSFLAGNGAKTN